MAENFCHSFPIAKSRIQHGFLLAAVLGLIGLWALFFADAAITGGPLLGLVNLGLAGGIALYNWRLAQDRRPRLQIDQQGSGTGTGRSTPFPGRRSRTPFKRVAACRLFFAFASVTPKVSSPLYLARNAPSPRQTA